MSESPEHPEIHVLDHKVRLLQAVDGFRTSLDSVFLAAACPARAGQHVLDMGCGVGGAGLCLLWRVQDSRLTGVEVQADHAALARRNIALNAMEGRGEIIHADIRDFAAPMGTFDHVICNPPYLEAGTYTESPKPAKARALGHLEADAAAGKAMSLKDWVDAGFAHLRSGGSLTMIHRADQVDKIILAMGRRFGAVEIIPLYPRIGEEAKRVIVRAVKDRKTPARLHAGIVLHQSGVGDYTKDADAILRDGRAIL